MVVEIWRVCGKILRPFPNRLTGNPVTNTGLLSVFNSHPSPIDPRRFPSLVVLPSIIKPFPFTKSSRMMVVLHFSAVTFCTSISWGSGVPFPFG
jgi:hypothetical protein